MATSVKEVPYDKSGNLLHYADIRYRARGLEDWRPNFPFQAVLSLAHMKSGYSAKYLVWIDEHGHRFPMFISDTMDLIKNGEISKGVATGLWIVRKRGQNYGVGIYTGPTS